MDIGRRSTITEVALDTVLVSVCKSLLYVTVVKMYNREKKTVMAIFLTVVVYS